MKKTILSITLVLSTGFTLANDKDYHEFCKSYSELAGTIMNSRQEGLPVSKLMDLMETDLERKIVLQAYKKTRWNTENSKKREIENFINDNYMICIQAKN